MSKIVVIGAGYVGLVTGACFAQKDNTVIIVENNKEKIKSLLNGQVPFYEPELDAIVQNGIQNQKLIFVDNLTKALEHDVQIIFSCVGTPSLPDGSADLSYVWQVAKEIGQTIKNYVLVVNKSTVPVGTGKNVNKIIKDQLDRKKLHIDYDVASNPEFLKEGDAVNDFMSPDRIVIGVSSSKAEQLLKDLYSPFIKTEKQFVSMNIESAELTKYASNAMLATRISFMNQIALLADKVGADILQVKKGMALDNRIGKFFLNSGLGFGGSCFPKDISALIHMGKEHEQPMTLLQEVENVNTHQRNWFAKQIIHHYGKNISNKIIGIWGLAFKPETDDIRCAPSIDIINILIKNGAKIIAYDSVAAENIKALMHDKIEIAQTAEEVLRKSDALAILTEWKEFLSFKPNKFVQLKDRIVFDGRNCFDPIAMQDEGIAYFTVGRNTLTRSWRAALSTGKPNMVIEQEQTL